MFQYLHTNPVIIGPGTYTQVSISEKWYSTELDSVFYKTSSSVFTPPGCEDCEPDFDGGEIDTLVYTQLDSVITALGNAPITEIVDSISSECVVNFESLGERYIDYEYDVYCMDSVLFVHENDLDQECYFLLGPGPDEEYNGYAPGLGLVKHYHYHPETSSEGSGGITNLIYWRKGTEECGNYNESLSVNEIKQADRILVYPNPSENGIFNLELSDFSRFLIHDMNGKLVLESLESVSTKIDLSMYTSGVYFLIVFDSNGNVVGREKLVR